MLPDRLKRIRTEATEKFRHRGRHRNLVAALGSDAVLGRYPLNVQIQTVSACNGKCKFCPYQESWHKTHPGVMDDRIYERIIGELAGFSLGRFCPYFENEPLLDAKLFHRIALAMDRLDFAQLELSTNAAVLDEDRIDAIRRLFPRVDHEIRISFHGVDAVSYESIMGLDFQATLERVLALVAAAQKTALNIVIRGAGQSRMERHRMPRWFDKKAYGAFWEDQFRRHGLRKRPRIDFFTYHDRAGQIGRNEIRYRNAVRSDLSGFYCHRLDRWAHFLYTGELVLCCMDYHRRTVFGDIARKDLRAIYADEPFTEIAARATGQRPSPEDFICKHCVSKD